jgi:uncharacterized protein YcbX
VTTVDQDSGIVTGSEPLAEMAKFRLYRRAGKSKLLFGQNMISEESAGVVRVGDAVSVMETKRPPKFA